MTNKEKYIESFADVGPSDEIKERILNMSLRKKKYPFKALAVTFAVLITVAAAMLTVNAATNGALGERIEEVSKEITEKISIIFNGEEIEAAVKRSIQTDENGNVVVVDIILPENEQSEDEIVFELEQTREDIIEKIIIQNSEESIDDVTAVADAD